MGKVDVSLVKYDDFPRLDPCAKLAGTFGIVVLGGVDKGKAREKTLQVQPQVAFGGCLATTMLGPVHARGDQLNGRRVHQMDRSLELPDKSLPGATTDELR